MKKTKLTLIFSIFCSMLFAQTGHLMQGIGAVNMSMGGAATGQPIDISGALNWNPAAISTFDGSILRVDAGAFFSSPKLYSSITDPGSGFTFSGETKDDRGTSVLPAIAFVWGKSDSRSKFGVSAFGISGFGVKFPENTNYPADMQGNMNPNFNPNEPTNPINWPQFAGGFGLIESNYMLLQVGLTWSYAFSDKFSIGLQPNFNYAGLELAPNPLSSPSPTKGYPTSNNASAFGYGGQVGLFFDSLNGFKFGLSYKSPQIFNEFEFENEYLDGSDAPDVDFRMDYPGIYSAGIGYSTNTIDLALDYRYVDYESTEGFEESGWSQTASVNGFGWQNISIISAGLQFKGIDRLPLRIGYTYSTNPINEELTFFSVPATAIIAHAFQFGLSYEFSERFSLDAVYHYGMSDGKTEGQLLNPMMISGQNPLGKIPGSYVAYDMTTSMIQVGLTFNLSKKDMDKDGISDDEDACPDVPGLKEFNGCPDTDGDGIADPQDVCPTIAGLSNMNGCPDSDGDGFSDQDDYCPEVAGLEQFNGCPDSDGDGVMDKMDECPNESGLIENKGCPLVDTDMDGVPNDQDECPSIAGDPANNGCPMITQEVQKSITDLARALYFNSGKSTFTTESLVRLEEISGILNKYTSSKFRVEGHTDSTGSASVNDKLSQSRAEAVMDYLIKNGFPADMITAKGYGSANPIGDNSTSKGRQANRRVDIFAEK